MCIMCCLLMIDMAGWSERQHDPLQAVVYYCQARNTQTKLVGTLKHLIENVSGIYLTH